MTTTHTPAAIQPDPEQHPDDEAVDRFAAAMKAKLRKKRAEGRSGWEGPECDANVLTRLLREHVEKGDPLDVGNLAMMLHQRGERIQTAPSSASVEAVPDHPPFDIPEVYNYYGHLSLKRENGKDYWSIECYDGHSWVPCDPNVAAALRAIEPK